MEKLKLMSDTRLSRWRLRFF